VQTPLFVVTGKKIDVCGGNGILPQVRIATTATSWPGTAARRRASSSRSAPPARLRPSARTTPATAGACGFASLNNLAPCTDGNVCTVGGTCTAGACVGTPRNCVDGNVCTTDLCTPPSVGCENLNNGLACDDLKAATADDVCSGGKCMGFIRHAALTLNGGENPSLAGFPAVGDARTDGATTRVSLINMDPARYPAGCTGVTVKVGGISGTATVTPFAAQAAPLVRATPVNFVANGTVAAGSSVDFRISCTVGGVDASDPLGGGGAVPQEADHSE
jgi:hypothetical protein